MNLKKGRTIMYIQTQIKFERARKKKGQIVLTDNSLFFFLLIEDMDLFFVRI